ncbi:S-adenosyl-L-methionine-dependent methyltransferase [Lentinula aff. detonsa]|uniref:S-adenosyl-L-methionine-dependent methyltransferase n=1 Tax=Lentinula aff. detonsa TaxID=2804958 RepID=A0AA38KRK5_9AGAR|nr:S-adenosyl-L-methionine-dependent methyltransferase [Lentinula aff. detonsa]
MSSNLNQESLSTTSYAPDSSGWSAALYNKNANFVYSPAYTSPVLDLLAARPGERVIDFGCGSGEVSLVIEKVVKEEKEGYVAAVDFSESMIEKAKAQGFAEAFVCDIQDFTFPPPGKYNGPREEFDAVFTNATLHWCKRDPSGVIKSAKKILKRNGRFVGEMGGFLNCIDISTSWFSGIRAALKSVLESKGYNAIERDPWFFPSPEEYSTLLKAEGFNITHISLTPRFTPLQTGLYGWLSTFARGSWLSDLPEHEAEEIMKEVEEICHVDCQDGNGNWAMVYVRLRFVAVLDG